MNKYILLIGLIILIASCKKGDNKPFSSLPADVKQYYDYKPGSYWIYRDSLTGAIDSMYISSRYYQEVRDENMYKCEYVSNSMNLVNISPSPLDTLGIALEFMGGEEVDGSCTNGLTMYRTVYSPLFYVPLKSSGLLTGNIQLLSTFSLNGTTYSNVAVVHSIGDYQNANNWFYINNDVGFIKMRIHHTQENYDRVFELVRCHIII